MVSNAKDGFSTEGRFVIDSRMLDHFSVAMYKDAKKAISELVANGYDADADSVEVSVPENWRSRSAKVIIRDNGNGMLPEDILEKFLRLGFNKRELTSVTAKGRRVMGSKGIGKLAGLGIAKAMRYSTTRKGTTSVFVIDREAMDKYGGDLEHVPIKIVSKATGKSNGTIVELYPLHTDIAPVSQEELRAHLAAEFADLPGFNVEVNGAPVVIEQLIGKRYLIDEQIKGYGKVTGWYKILRDPTKQAGLSVRARGRMVKTRSTFSIGPAASHAINYAYIVGDVNADFLDPDSPKNKMEEFTIATDREGFNESSPAYKAFEEWAIGTLKKIADEVQEVRTESAFTKVRKSRRIRKSLSRLPEKVREQALVLVERLVEEIPWEDLEQILDIVKIVLDSVGASEVMMILRELEKADPADVKGFAKLIEQYGVADVWKLAEHAAERLEAIDFFEKLITRADALELEQVHPLIENNTWLLSEDYELLSSNENIATLLRKELSLDKKEERDRPDFVCRSTKNWVVVIELKRPSYGLGPEDFSQIVKYVEVLKKYYLESKLEAYMIGGSCSSISSGTSLISQVPVTMTTYRLLVESAKTRYKHFLEGLKGAR